MYKHNTNERIQIEWHKFRKNKRTRGLRYDNLGCLSPFRKIGKASFRNSRMNSLQALESFQYCHGEYHLTANRELKPIGEKSFHNFGRRERNFCLIEVDKEYWQPNLVL